MAAEQSLIQIRVDSQLKEQANEVFEKIGRLCHSRTAEE